MWNPPVEQPQEAVWNSSSTLSIPLSLENIQKLLPREPKQSLRSISLLGSSRYQSKVWSPQYQRYTFTSTQPASDTHTKKRSTLFSTRPAPHTLTQDRFTYFSTQPEPHTHTQDGFTSFSSVPPSHTRSYTRERSTPFFPPLRSVHSQRFSSPNTLRLNLTCMAIVGQLSFRTTTWSAVSLPSVIHPNGLMKSSGNAGKLRLASIYILGDFSLHVLTIDTFSFYYA